MNESQVINAMGALAHQSRLRVVRMLVASGDEGMTAGDIAQKIKATPSKVSFHLSALEQAGLVKTKRISRHIFYRANYARIGKIMNYLLTDCCGSDKRIIACCGFSDDECC
jgi:DNA-binding transcriptional ArsR family regulator